MKSSNTNLGSSTQMKQRKSECLPLQLTADESAYQVLSYEKRAEIT